MPRARTIPDPSPVSPSNVVELRPGFALPAAEVVPKKRPKSSRMKVTTPPDLIRRVTSEDGKNGIKLNDLIETPGLMELEVHRDVSPPQLNPSAKDPTFLRLVRTLPRMKLRAAFPREANSHANMKARCKAKGGRLASEFVDLGSCLEHVGPCPADGWTLDRIDPSDPEYAPGKVRWADKRQQANNRAVTVHLTLDGVTRPLADWSRLKGVDRRTLAKRIDRGWTHAEAIRGRRVEDEPKAVPVPAVAPVEPLADAWPTGATPSKWEPAFRAYKSRFSPHVIQDLSRAVFFAWLGGNRLRLTAARLRDRFPGFDDPDATEPPSARADPQYAVIVAYEAPVREALRMVWADPYQRELLRGLRLQWPDITDPEHVRTDCLIR